MRRAPPLEGPAFWLLGSRQSLRKRIAAYVITSHEEVRRSQVYDRFAAWPRAAVRLELDSLIRSRVIVDHGGGWIGHLCPPELCAAWRKESP